MEIHEELAYSQRIALSWVLLAEAARRHPSGQISHDWHHWYDSLQFAVDSEKAILCNRAGRIHLIGISGSAAWEPLPNRDGWSLVMLQGPRRSVKEIESIIRIAITSTCTGHDAAHVDLPRTGRSEFTLAAAWRLPGPADQADQ